MSEAQPIRAFPRGALLGAAFLVGLTITASASARLLGLKQPLPTATALVARDLRFVDQQDGGVTVLDAKSGATIKVLAPGTNGFIRASLRSLAKRRMFDGEESQVFHLTAWSDGRLTLDDPATDNPIELEAFGPTNAMAFAVLLDPNAVSR